jgi:hypothetical protein
MKVALQQYKPNIALYILGILSLTLFLADVGWILQFYGFGDHTHSAWRVIVWRTIIPAFIISVVILQVKMVVVDLESKTIKTYYRFLRMRVPLSTKPLPEINYVSAFRQLLVIGKPNNNGDTVASFTYDIKLFHAKGNIALCSQYTAEDALSMAKELAEKLHCGLFDATDPDDKVWLIEESQE